MTTDIEQLQQANKMLAAIETAEDARIVADFAAAAATWAKKAGLGRSASNHAKAVEVKALMRMADLIDQGQAGGQATHGGDRSGKVTRVTLQEVGTNKVMLQRARIVRDHYDDAMVDELAADATKELSLGRCVSLANKAHPDANDWYTPPWLFEQIGITFDMDVCAPKDPTMRTCPANTYYTEDDDGLAQQWKGTVWCNPPYSTPEAWTDRMADHKNGILLVHMPNNAGWMVRAQHAASSVRLIQSMHFVRPSGDLQRPGYSLMLATYGDDLIDALDGIIGDKVGPLWRP